MSTAWHKFRNACFITISVFQVTVASATVAKENVRLAHNTWTSGAAVPIPTWLAATTALRTQIYVIGGQNNGSLLADVQVYDPATDTWSTDSSIPAPTFNGSAAAVHGAIYVLGGSNDGVTTTNAVWEFTSRNGWVKKSPMPTAAAATEAVVYNNIIYLIGGVTGQLYSPTPLAIVQSYNPATDAWATNVASLPDSPFNAAAGIEKHTGMIVVADGAIAYGVVTGDTETYNVSTNAWTSQVPDPTPRTGPCYGAIGSKLYVAGGTAPTTLNEVYNISKNTWAALSPLPQAIIFPSSAIYKGRLYCFGGLDGYGGSTLNYLQIYQP